MANLDTKIEGLPVKIWAIVVIAGLGIGIYINSKMRQQASSSQDVSANLPVAVSRGAPGYIPEAVYTQPPPLQSSPVATPTSPAPAPTPVNPAVVAPAPLSPAPASVPNQQTLYTIHDDSSAEDHFGNHVYPIFGQYPWFSYFGVVAYSPDPLAPGIYQIGQKPVPYGTFSGGESAPDAASAYQMYDASWANSPDNAAYGTTGLYKINPDLSVDADNGQHYSVSSATGGVWLSAAPDGTYVPHYGGINVWYAPGIYAVGQMPPPNVGGSTYATDQRYTSYQPGGAGPNYGWLAWLFNPPQHGAHPYDSGGSTGSPYPGVSAQTDCGSTYKGRLFSTLDGYSEAKGHAKGRHVPGGRGEMERRNAVGYAVSGLGGWKGKLWWTEIADPTNRAMINRTRRQNGLKVLTNAEFDAMQAQMQAMIPNPGQGRPDLNPYADALFLSWNLPYQCGK